MTEHRTAEERLQRCKEHVVNDHIAETRDRYVLRADALQAIRDAQQAAEGERARADALLAALQFLVHATEYDAQYKGHPSWCKLVIDGHPCSCSVGDLKSAHKRASEALAACEKGDDDGQG